MARVMNEIKATPVTPYVSKPSAVGPTESPALSPVQSAMTPGLRGSSSLTLNTIFIKSEPMSAILVKMPPAIRRAEAPSDLPRHEQQDDDHHHQLERDQVQTNRHAGPQRDVDHVPRFPAQRGEGGA